MEGPAGLHLLPGIVTTTRESIRFVQPVHPVHPRLNQMDRSGMPFLMVVPARDGSPTIELRRCCERDIVAPMHHSIDPFRPPEPFR
jgi:hypothetical protein